MNLLESAAQTVMAALQAKRVGTPVFVRLVAHTTDDHGRIEPLLGAALEAAKSWLGDEVSHLAALGGVAVDRQPLRAALAENRRRRDSRVDEPPIVGRRRLP